jgi:signal transduction histidine kinase
VAPQFYQTAWFQASVVATLLLIAAGLHHLRVRRIEAQFALVMKERNRIAREIHDGLAQGLAAIGLHLSAIQADRPGSDHDRHLEKARQLVVANLGETRRSVWDLHPQYIERNDLVSGLRRMAVDLGESANVAASVRTVGVPYPLSEQVERNVFRIAQEAVANAIRHAAARQVTVEVRFERRHLRLAVADDGHGFDPAAASEGFGLTSMRERAAQVNGTLRVDSLQPSGTSVTVTVPVIPRDRWPALSRALALFRTARKHHVSN